MADRFIKTYQEYVTEIYKAISVVEDGGAVVTIDLEDDKENPQEIDLHQSENQLETEQPQEIEIPADDDQ